MEANISERINRLLISLVHDGFMSPREYAVKKIDFSLCKNPPSVRFNPEMTPYLLPVLDAWDFTGRKKEITVVGIEQTGKTLSWLIPLLWSFEHKPGTSIAVYPSDDLCVRVNETKLLPLMQAIPALAEQLAMPRSKRVNSYNLADSISYFWGAGARVTSISSNINIADEIDDWIEHDGQVSNLEDLRKRARAFNESMLCKVCSPTTSGGAIWKEFKQSSEGFYYLRCLNCCELTMRSADIHNLQFETYENDGQKELVVGSERLRCPVCKHEHKEIYRQQMNISGGYIHKKPELIDTMPGFQWGALASCLPDFSFTKLALAQLKAGKSGSVKDQRYFDNSIRGLPFETRALMGDTEEKLLKHCPEDLPDPETLEAIFLSIDTQDYGWKWELRGFDVNSNRWLLSYGVCEYLELLDDERAVINERLEQTANEQGEHFEPIVTIEDILYKEWRGIIPLLALMDEGGHRKREVFPFVQKHEKLYSYKGNNQGMDKWRLSENLPKLILAHEKDYQSDLIYYLYAQNNRDNNYWYILPGADSEYLKELAAVRPDATKRDGHQYENWDHNGRVHDFFDTGKMYLVIEDVAVSSLERKYFRHNKAEILKIPGDSSDASAADQSATPRKSWVKNW